MITRVRARATLFTTNNLHRTYALALLWARWKATFFHYTFCMSFFHCLFYFCHALFYLSFVIAKRMGHEYNRLSISNINENKYKKKELLNIHILCTHVCKFVIFFCKNITSTEVKYRK